MSLTEEDIVITHKPQEDGSLVLEAKLECVVSYMLPATTVADKRTVALVEEQLKHVLMEKYQAVRG